jgi:hypothetical protein
MSSGARRSASAVHLRTATEGPLGPRGPKRQAPRFPAALPSFRTVPEPRLAPRLNMDKHGTYKSVEIAIERATAEIQRPARAVMRLHRANEHLLEDRRAAFMRCHFTKE